MTPGRSMGRKPHRRNRERKQENIQRICRLCESRVKHVDFKDSELLKKFQTEKGRILPRRITNTCLRHQKMLSAAIKRARIIGLVL